MSRDDITTMAGDRADRTGVERFAAAMSDKLHLKADEGRGGWNKPDECSVEDLCLMMAAHIKKGDMVDVANFAMMIWNRENPKGKPR